jgi:hypothetical protein
MTRLIPALAALMLSAAPAVAERVSVLVFDASGSMWNRVEGDLTRIEVARDVMGDYFASRDGAVPLSVIAYGHNRRGDCRDIEVVAPMGQTAPGALETRLRALMPRGMTPLTDSLALARDQIPPTAEGADIILVTDGLETCDGDPCALAASLAAEGIDIRAHVVGFGLTAAEVAALSCITDQTGGMLFQTNSGAELALALQQVSVVAPPPPPVAEPGTPALFAQNFVFRDIGTGTPRGLMEWRAEAPDGTVIDLGTTDGIQQSLQGVSVEMPLGDWLIVAEGAEGRAERQMTLTQCCGMHGIPFTGTDMAAVIPPLSQVQAGMDARLAYEITHPGVGNLGGTPYQVIATGPEGALSPDQILRQDLITRRDSGIHGARTGELAPGTYRFLIAIARNGGYDIRAERTFEAVANPAIRVVAPQQAMPGERVEVRFDGGYATRHHVTVVDENGRDVGQGNSLNRGPGGGSGGPVTMNIVMPNREGLFDIVVRPSSSPNDRGTVLARQPITISATPAPAQGQDTLPMVTATFRQPPGLPFDMSHWRAEPLDPDLPPEGLRIDGTGPVVTATLQPGRWRIIAEGMADTILYTEVDIFPGQPNDFTLDMDAMQVDGALTGDWTLWALPPQGISDPPMNFARISLRPTMEGMDYEGSFTTTAAMGGVQSGDLQSVTIDGDGLLEILFVLPAVGPEPLRLALMQPLGGAGFEGQLIARTGAFPVALLPEGTPPPERQGSVAPQGNIPNDADIAARCDTPGGCAVTFGTVSLTLPEGWAMTEPLFIRATADASPTDLPRAEFHGPGTNFELRLNPHQWLTSNGPCLTTQAGALCWFADAPPAVVNAAAVIASSLALASSAPASTPPKAVAGSVTVGLLDPDIIAGSGGFFPIDIAAPQGFEGAVSLHDGTGTVIFSADAAFMLGAQDQVLPVPDAPGPHEIRVTDNTGALRATTGFFAEAAPAPVQVPVTADATGIRVTLTATTQFGAACTIGSSLTMPDGPVFTFAATVRGEDNNGQTIDALMRTEGDQRIDITGFGGAGAARFEIGYRAPCENVILQIAEAQCSIGDGAAPGACPHPVTYVIPSNLLGVFLSGSDRIEQASLPTPAPERQGVATAPAPSEPRFIPITLGDRDADDIIDLLFPPN